MVRTQFIAKIVCPDTFTGKHLLVNTIAMCLFPFVARPIIQNIFQMSDAEYQAYLELRQTEVIDFVHKSLAV